ncbi:hypothetical protein [Flavobacterium sp. LC2016-01]|uniref:hypothetical protein n=1 Tax=Flavobacterium sp. LC2016-01 TaxID=2675876 RepID=UPI0012BA9592|nr:hypothetical protein [Flavobacterium sp. LC2016-01]MTH17939.1 hypothetical protein [Flavobacterium sp. LC2016-01]
MIKKADVYFTIALISAIYFAMVCGAWIFFMNLFLGPPVFIISYMFWKKGLKIDIRIDRYKYIKYAWWSGIPISVLSLSGYLIFD